jgi:N-acyl-D-amino-acid deacylase
MSFSLVYVLRRAARRLGGATFALCCAAPMLAIAAPPDDATFDLIIRNGRIVDGTGNPWWHGDVAVKGERIVALGKFTERTAKRTIDARGSVISPGFIDMHSHASWHYLVDSRAASKVTQGITLEIEGEGHSVAPLDAAGRAREQAEFARFGITPTWGSLAEFFARLEAQPATINFATHLGTANLREIAVGFDDRAATADELERMRRMTETAMREGALGVYSALMYSPDRYNRTEELIEMAKVAARYGGVYQTHQRSESDAATASMQEVFRIAREACIPAHITHLKVAYRQNWGRMAEFIRAIEDARASGLDITADMYPYEQAAGSFGALLPPWTHVGGRDKLVQRLSDLATRERIKQELAAPATTWENEYYGTGGGPAGITLVDAQGNQHLKPFEGKTLAAIAAAWKIDPRDALLDIVRESDAGLTVLITNEKDIRLAIAQPWVAFGTDGGSTAADGPLSQGLTHPRGYGTLPRVLGRYVRELGLVRLEDAVRRATSLAAQTLNIRDRGVLREGYFADIVVFDPATIIDTATYEAPHRYAKGVQYVIVNGQVVLDEGRITDARPGKVVRGPGFGMTAPQATSCRPHSGR